MAHVAITEATGPVGVGSSAQLAATVTDAQGDVLEGRVVSWASSDMTIATVTAAGVVSGVAKGAATITATSEDVTASLEVPVAYLFTDVAAGSDYTCARTTGSAAFCWGAGDRGQLGIGSTPSSEPVSVEVSGGLRVMTLSANKASGSGRHTCALLEEGAVACWGDGALGQLGNGGSALSTTPVVLSGVPALRMDVRVHHRFGDSSDSEDTWSPEISAGAGYHF